MGMKPSVSHRVSYSDYHLPLSSYGCIYATSYRIETDMVHFPDKSGPQFPSENHELVELPKPLTITTSIELEVDNIEGCSADI
jgi:hypothetical protein